MQAHVASLPGPAAVPSYLDGGRRRKVMAGVMDAWGRSILEYGLSLPIPIQNISSSTHHIKSFDTCMEH
jgi:hypothetical protein